MNQIFKNIQPAELAIVKAPIFSEEEIRISTINWNMQFPAKVKGERNQGEKDWAKMPNKDLQDYLEWSLAYLQGKADLPFLAKATSALKKLESARLAFDKDQDLKNLLTNPIKLISLTAFPVKDLPDKFSQNADSEALETFIFAMQKEEQSAIAAGKDITPTTHLPIQIVATILGKDEGSVRALLNASGQEEFLNNCTRAVSGVSAQVAELLVRPSYYVPLEENLFFKTVSSLVELDVALALRKPLDLKIWQLCKERSWSEPFKPGTFPNVIKMALAVSWLKGVPARKALRLILSELQSRGYKIHVHPTYEENIKDLKSRYAFPWYVANRIVLGLNGGTIKFKTTDGKKYQVDTMAGASIVQGQSAQNIYVHTPSRSTKNPPQQNPDLLQTAKIDLGGGSTVQATQDPTQLENLEDEKIVSKIKVPTISLGAGFPQMDQESNSPSYDELPVFPEKCPSCQLELGCPVCYERLKGYFCPNCGENIKNINDKN